MIKRIVKMTFVPEKTNEFIEIYRRSNSLIRNFNGCKHVELLRERENGNVFFTYSIWESEKHLDAYRNSDLFKGVWSSTKALFAARAEAWTVSEISF